MRLNQGKRMFKHLLLPGWWVRRGFNRSVLTAITQAIKASERKHRGELRFVAEGPLPWGYLWRRASVRQRATDLFSVLRIWDTEGNSGVLIYVQLVDQRVEILADRGIAAAVPQSEWNAVCRVLEWAFKAGNYGEGALAAVAQVGALLETHFPAQGERRDELPDAPLLL